MEIPNFNFPPEPAVVALFVDARLLHTRRPPVTDLGAARYERHSRSTSGLC
jgi:hypothetical protein